MASVEAESAEAQTSRPKRQKIQVACTRCRTKKIKCDGRRPVCGPCESKYGQQAECNLRTTPNQELDSFRDRIAQLDEQVRELKRKERQSPAASKTQTFANERPHSPTRNAFPQMYKHPASSNPVNFMQDSGLDRPSASPMNNSPSEDTRQSLHFNPFSSSVDWRQSWPVQQNSAALETQREVQPHSQSDDGEVDAMMGATSDEHSSQAFFGMSSAGRFVQQIRSAMNNSASIPRVSSTPSVSAQARAATSTPIQSKNWSPAAHNPLPPKDTADRLFQIYWRIVHPLYPFLDRNDTQQLYMEVSKEKISTERHASFLCQLNVIFALTCQLDEDISPSRRAASAAVYIDRAKKTIDHNIWQGASITSIQTFLIFAQYLQSTNNAYQCWIVVGHAIRMAQSLGLHLRDTTEKIGSPRRRQIHRKVWHGCILMDRVVSMTYGRPAMIEEKAATSVPPPIAVDDEHLTDNPEQRTTRLLNRPMLVDFYVQTLRLYEILNKVLNALYATENAGEEQSDDDDDEMFGLVSKTDGQASLLQLDHSLTVWHKKLPNHLCIRIEYPSNDTFYRQARILYSRYLHVRILLYRPVLSRFIAAQNSPQHEFALTRTTLSWQLAFRCSLLCVESAQHAITAIGGSLPATTAITGSLPAWWYNVLYVYTAATVLLAALLCPAITAEVPQKEMMISWRNAIGVLRQYRSFSPSVRKSIAALEILFKRIPVQELQEGTTERPNTNLALEARSRYDKDARMNDTTQHNVPDFGVQQQEAQLLQAAENIGTGTEVNEDMRCDLNESARLSSVDESPNFTFDPYDFNLSFDITDLSWLNSLPSNF